MKAYLEIIEVDQLEAAATCLRDRLLIRVLSRTGCRVSEALAIKAGDIDWNRGTLTILHLKARVRLSCPACSCRLSKAARFCPSCGVRVEGAVAEEKKRHRQRTVPLDKDTLQMLKEYVKQGGPRQEGCLFGLGRGHAWRIIRDCAERARLGHLDNPETGQARGISPHRLRDAFAVRAVKMDDSGDGLRLLQEHLGHQSITTTMRYRKVSGEEQKEWYQKLWTGEEQHG